MSSCREHRLLIITRMRHADMLCTYVRTVVRRGATRYLMPVLVSYTMGSLLIKRDDSKKNGKNSAKIPKIRTNEFEH